MSGRGWWAGTAGRAVVRLDEASRRLAVLEARVALARLASGDTAGAYQAATRAEGEAMVAGWAAMQAAARRLQDRACEQEAREAEQVMRAEHDSLMSWGLW
jgi:hypothetical protein